MTANTELHAKTLCAKLRAEGKQPGIVIALPHMIEIGRQTGLEGEVLQEALDFMQDNGWITPAVEAGLFSFTHAGWTNGSA